jgi:hypothetical protein
MAIKKAAKTHTSSRKKASASASTKGRTKKVSAKPSDRTGKSASKRKLTKAEWRKLQELNLKVLQTVYDDYQQGKFRLLF